jgi:hypothetical protein
MDHLRRDNRASTKKPLKNTVSHPCAFSQRLAEDAFKQLYIPWAHCGAFDQHCSDEDCEHHAPAMLKRERKACGRCRSTTYCSKGLYVTFELRLGLTWQYRTPAASLAKYVLLDLVLSKNTDNGFTVGHKLHCFKA